MNHLPYIAQRMLNVPVAIHPAKAQLIVTALADRMGIGQVARASDFDDDDHDMSTPGRNPRTGYDVVEGVAVIQVAGTLVQKLGTLRPVSGMTGYDGIRQNVLMALNDSSVKGLMLEISSPGGEVAGCFDLVDTIYKARSIKPIWALANEMAFSAGYAIASACERVVLPRTGSTGSVGVVIIHQDMSDAIEKAGIKVTIISYGDFKADGNPFQRLSKETRDRVQTDINTMGELFVGAVARNRSMSRSSVRNTQALCYLGQDGVDIGLADAIMSPDEAFLEFLESLQ